MLSLLTNTSRLDHSTADDSTARGGDGCGDVARALAGVADIFFCVTGQPVTHIVELLTALTAHSEITANEKSAIEAAVGASAVGARSCVVVKHCGLAFAVDSMANAALHTTGAGILVISGDDCDASHSTCIFDSRQLGEITRVPVVDLALNGDVVEVIRAAMRLSESARVPVVVRVTEAVHQSCAEVDRPVASVEPPWQTPLLRRVDRDVAHVLTKLGRHQWHRQTTMPMVREMLAKPPMIEATCEDVCNVAVVVAGAAERYVPVGGICRLLVRGAWPIPAEVVEFARRHRRIVVVEEPMPHLERALASALASPSEALVGRLSGHLPPEGRLSPGLVASALSGHPPSPWTEVNRKPVGVIRTTPYDPLFDAVARMQRAGAFVATDVGSSVQLCYPPFRAASVALSLGSAIGVAGGAARLGHRSIAVLGDYALTHSGLEALLDCVAHELPVLVVVLANGSQAQTGGQPVPAADRVALIRACGVHVVEEWPVADAARVHRRLTALICGQLPAAVLVTEAGRQ
jgi:indolepyruvate ferredoxin oxidoreductase alpha subunit